MAGKAKRQAARDTRKKKVASARALKQADYAAKIAAGRNTKSAAKRLQQKRQTERKVKNIKKLSGSHTLPYVPASMFWATYWKRSGVTVS